MRALGLFALFFAAGAFGAFQVYDQHGTPLEWTGTITVQVPDTPKPDPDPPPAPDPEPDPAPDPVPVPPIAPSWTSDGTLIADQAATMQPGEWRLNDPRVTPAQTGAPSTS